MTIANIKAPNVTRKPYVGDVTVSLEEFEPDQIAEYLRAIGYQVDGTFSRAILDAADGVARDRRRCDSDYDSKHDPMWEEGAWITGRELNRAETLLICGQRESARELILASVSHALGRTL